MAPIERNVDNKSINNPKATLKSPNYGKSKLSVAEPTSFSKFLVILMMHICKRVLLVDTVWKVGLYLCGLTVVSLFTDLFPFPASYFSNKSNPLNLYLVKWGWGWTCAILGSFVYFTSVTYCIGNVKLVCLRHLSRLAVATIWWFVCVTIMNYIEHITGFCTSNEHPSKHSCKSAGYNWISWDPSGHSFLLIHSLLVISEEVKCIKSWDTILQVVENKDEKPGWRLAQNESEELQKLYNDNTPVIRIILILLTFLQLIWEIMLLATTVYFHNMPSKLMGAALAVLGWILTYQWWYKQENVLPSEPGVGRFKYMKDV